LNLHVHASVAFGLDDDLGDEETDGRKYARIKCRCRILE